MKFECSGVRGPNDNDINLVSQLMIMTEHMHVLTRTSFVLFDLSTTLMISSTVTTLVVVSQQSDDHRMHDVFIQHRKSSVCDVTNKHELMRTNKCNEITRSV